MTGYHAAIAGGKYYTRLNRFSNPFGDRMVKRRMKRIFERDFAKLADHPLETLRSAFENTTVENREYWIIFNQAYRAFFSTYNRGILSEANDPYLMPTRLDTPFFDQDLIEFLLSVDKTLILDYYLYRKAYFEYFPDLLEIPTSQPGFKRDDSLSNPFPIVLKEKLARLGEVYKLFVAEDQTWGRGVLKRDYFSSLKNLEDNPLFYCFIDFELWCRRYLT